MLDFTSDKYSGWGLLIEHIDVLITTENKTSQLGLHVSSFSWAKTKAQNVGYGLSASFHPSKSMVRLSKCNELSLSRHHHTCGTNSFPESYLKNRRGRYTTIQRPDRAGNGHGSVQQPSSARSRGALTYSIIRLWDMVYVPLVSWMVNIRVIPICVANVHIRTCLDFVHNTDVCKASGQPLITTVVSNAAVNYMVIFLDCSLSKTFISPFFVTFKMSVFRLTTPDWRGPQTQWRQRGNESVKRWIGVPTTLILTYLQTTWLNRNTTSPVKHSSVRKTLTENFQISDILLRFQTIAAQSRALSKTWPNFAHFDHHPTCKIKGKMENSKW